MVDDNSTIVIYLFLKGDLLKFPSSPSFRIGSIAQKENLETLWVFKPLETLNFLCQTLRNSTSICQNNDFSSRISSKYQLKYYLSTNLPHNLYCILLIKYLTSNQFHNILRRFDVSPKIPFTTSERMGDYYLYTWYKRVVSRVAEELIT